MPRKRHTEVSHYDDSYEVGRRLREAREQAGLSQRQLSFPGCSPAYLSRIEAGDRTPSLQLMRELARRLGVTEEYLAYGKEPRPARIDSLLEAEIAMRMDDRELAEQLFRAELESEDHSRRAAAREGLGQLAFRAGNPREAIGLLEQAASEYGDEAISRRALNDSLGRAYASVGNLEASIAVFERSLRAAKEREDVLDELRFAVLLASVLVDAGRASQAEEHVASALTHAAELADPLARIRLYWTQCRLHIANERPELADRYARKVIELLELTEDSHTLSRAYRQMANLELNRGRAAEARGLVQRAQTALGETGDEAEAAANRLVEARTLAQLGELDKAASLAKGLTGALADRPEETGRSYSVLAKTFADAGDRVRAIELYELAAEHLERTPNRWLVEAYARLAELLEAEGKQDAALELLKKAVGVRTEVAQDSSR